MPPRSSRLAAGLIALLMGLTLALLGLPSAFSGLSSAWAAGERAPAGSARSDGRTQEAWVSAVVTRITRADLRAPRRGEPGGTVTVRVRVNADGALADAAVEGGDAGLGARALAAIRAAAPFGPPPRGLLTLEGYTELSFPLDLAGAR